MSHQRLFRLHKLPHVAVAAVALAGASGALAQTGNAASGATLYKTRVQPSIANLSPSSCEDCHGSGNSLYLTLGRNSTPTEASVLSAINGAIGGNRGGMGAYSTWSAQQRADVAAYVVSQSPAPPPPFGGGGGTVVATPTATPNPATFANTPVGSRSAAVTIMVTNAAAAAVTFAAQPIAVLGGGNGGDFWINATPSGMAACTGTLAPGGSCALSVDFRPTATGTRTVAWTLNFTNAQARTLTFTGSGTSGATPAPAPAPAPAPTPAPTPTPAPAPTPTPAPAPAPAPATAPATSTAPSASKPADGGAGALPLLGLPALIVAAALRRRRRD
jgi:hypothetical protein